MKTMRAYFIENPGPNSNLVLKETPTPTPSAGEVLIKVHAAGINRPDLIQRSGNYPPPKGITEIPGLEVAGEIIDINGCAEFETGDRVMALIAGGGYAEYCVAPAPQVLPLPTDDMPYTDAAAIPETFFTVWTNLFDSGELQDGERILIHGGSSGIGTTAIQIAKHYDCEVFITAGTDEKCQACLDLGADHAINYKTQDFLEQIMDLTDDEGVGVVLDMVGGPYLNRNIQCLAPFGRHVSIAMLQGRTAEIEIFRIMKNRLTLTGSTLRARDIDEKGDIADHLSANLWPVIAEGKIKPIIDSIFNFEDAEAAHQKMQDSTHIGKIVLKII